MRAGILTCFFLLGGQEVREKVRGERRLTFSCSLRLEACSCSYSNRENGVDLPGTRAAERRGDDLGQKKAIRAGDEEALDEFSQPQRAAMLALSGDFGRR